MTTRLRAAAEAALDALVCITGEGRVSPDGAARAIVSMVALRAALAEHQERVPLTLGQLSTLWEESESRSRYPERPATRLFARAIERAHGIGKESSDET